MVRGIALLLLLLAGPAVRAADALCSPSPTRLCLLGGRFSATLRWDDGSGAHDALVAAPRADAGGSASGLFYFYGSDPSNWEVLVKMIDGCRTNGRYWLLVSASTGFEWRLEVVDEAKTIGRAWFHPLDGNASGVSDFAAFRGCPAQGLPPSLRYRNDLACGSTRFLSVLSAGARAWESSSGVASRPSAACIGWRASRVRSCWSWPQASSSPSGRWISGRSGKARRSAAWWES